MLDAYLVYRDNKRLGATTATKCESTISKVGWWRVRDSALRPSNSLRISWSDCAETALLTLSDATRRNQDPHLVDRPGTAQ